MAVLALAQSADQQPNAIELAPEEGYQAIRYNALKHGVLAKLTVLPHEDASEFEALWEALVEEHQPSGPTEAHVVEYLAAIMWRKRRILLAENAEINNGLRGVVNYSSNTPAKSAAPFMSGMPDKPSDWLDLMQATPDEVKQSQRDIEEYRNLLDEVWSILRKGGSRAYAKALKMLSEEDRETWKELVAMDTDEAGSKAAKWWLDNVPRVAP